ncbi:adenine-specific methyltransferase EcoRI family protein [Gardnerella vaginalis]|uniref:adenine-specific methyltransferase EcoRI family protein n=1 Tax=Gardnerella vaginalis TaxID=2702 RepID=UPI0003538E93|nr:adenine-specific methyltransferase EcoRI family protein [Gardnerella vaginalis]EPI56806.1 hypothetical protein HMPREF1572_00680 [Gardnerella vaginalis JCP7275]
MAGNSGLSNATKAKKDEFYTQLTDIEKEMRYYRAHFKGKTVFCNCDDPFESNFFKYFVLNFNKLGLKKLIATCYATSPIANQQLTLFDVIGGEEENRDKPYKAVVTKVYDKTGDGGVDMFDVAELFKSGENELTELAGDGDFRSKECLELLDEADIVVTNPPFSLFRDYVATLMEHKKKFIIIGNQNAITYKEIFPLLMNNEIWLGNGFSGNVGFFSSPYDDIAASSQHKEGFIRVSGVVWFTNLDIKKRHEELILVKRYSPDIYLHYDNYDAINVNKTVEIPCDYSGVMGVPITFLDKYSPDQFEILGVTQSWCGVASKIYPKQVQIDKNGKRSQVTKLNDGAAIKVEVPPKGKTYYDVDGELFVKTYARVLVRNKHPEAPREV